MRLVSAIGLVISGFLNLAAGFLALFPSLFEVAVQRENAGGGEVGLLELLGTPYGRWSLSLFAVGSLQLGAMSALGWLASGASHATLALVVLAFASAGIELWGIGVKEEMSVLNAPGLLTAAAIAALALTARRP